MGHVDRAECYPNYVRAVERTLPSTVVADRRRAARRISGPGAMVWVRDAWDGDYGWRWRARVPGWARLPSRCWRYPPARRTNPVAPRRTSTPWRLTRQAACGRPAALARACYILRRRGRARLDVVLGGGASGHDLGPGREGGRHDTMVPGEMGAGPGHLRDEALNQLVGREDERPVPSRQGRLNRNCRRPSSNCDKRSVVMG